MSKVKYMLYQDKDITRDILDHIKIGDRVKLNGDKRPMRIIATSENYMLAIQNVFGNTLYSVISKNKAKHNRNNVTKGRYYYGADNWISGYRNQGHHWENKEWLKTYLESFESGETEITTRNSVDLEKIAIKLQREEINE